MHQRAQQMGKKVSDGEMQQRACDNACRFVIATIVMEYWDNSWRKHIKKLVLEKAVQEQLISENNLQ